MSLTEKNVELASEFSKYIFDHPELESRIPGDASIVLLPEYDKVLRSHNLKTGKQMEKGGKNVFYIRIKSLRPRVLSRIEHVAMGA
ncbi:MAG: hypothetical protein A2268_10355 [Candidatus Raymondbacteria bacterium RifOxyA12_full_50_37]|uniref:Uncharacterized protein n=1 Tax=Candidatus Raymondbacteria bacterium RIFOXYD12_FULL_49_13 TaxID=1817890 RepID=A0A1F7FKH4_UNCRA|nr:MAG: hypothetical protein A2268_10355 [Candidatus Raymondbacteria bacterium RifOxyA12_full_50_37]OGJ90163.1 MAG: hypothetical protein A2248_16835 [Candidatus Raymondbacteria bacterium RIFOXYA2_FULL_49_16]OGJ97234.1 MAG: hypothetical protein A2453_01325 [Candidatus Raymondbacteria bacterium RIFOXYC2_FULL_50_21]OGK04501.1 MAG: hypothetical protein A2350_15370 [Candidatus Raymondbacteria bacterium RifOxyB12_full_50_8]OGK06503.1 MAG: hypothetical protein A2487_21465 [Candidatus Raymondbacteria b